MMPFGRSLLARLRDTYRQWKRFFWVMRGFGRRGRAERSLAVGHWLVQHRIPAQALAWFTRAIRLAPEVSGAYLARGLLLRQLGRPEEARQDFQAGLALANSSADRMALHASLAGVLADLHDVDS